jgi:hypothetical protein
VAVVVALHNLQALEAQQQVAAAVAVQAAKTMAAPAALQTQAVVAEEQPKVAPTHQHLAVQAVQDM